MDFFSITTVEEYLNHAVPNGSNPHPFDKNQTPGAKRPIPNIYPLVEKCQEQYKLNGRPITGLSIVVEDTDLFIKQYKQDKLNGREQYKKKVEEIQKSDASSNLGEITQDSTTTQELDTNSTINSDDFFDFSSSEFRELYTDAHTNLTSSKSNNGTSQGLTAGTSQCITDPIGTLAVASLLVLSAGLTVQYVYNQLCHSQQHHNVQTSGSIDSEKQSLINKERNNGDVITLIPYAGYSSTKKGQTVVEIDQPTL